MRLSLLYLSVWFLPLTSGFWYDSDFNLGFSLLSLSYMSGLIVVLIMCNAVNTLIFKTDIKLEKIVAKFDQEKAIVFQKKCLAIWYVIFACEIIVSGGAPILWGAERGYGSFGLPVIHGFSNMLRGMIFAHLVLFLVLGFRFSRWITFFSLMPIISALFIEESRGAFVMSIFFGLSPLLLFYKLKPITVLKISLIVPTLVFTLSAFQFFRHADSPTQELEDIIDLSLNNEKAYQYLIEPVANYIATPALNAGLNIDTADFISMRPNETLKPLFPSLIREAIWEIGSDQGVGYGFKNDYGLLVSDAFNTSSLLTPFVRDFGLLGTYIFFAFFFFLTSFWFCRAKAGNVEDIIRMPPLIMCIGLSFFTTYLTSLVTIIYLLLAGPIAKRIT